MPISTMRPRIIWHSDATLHTNFCLFAGKTGWSAHVMEQRANNRIIRPSAEYTGPESAEWIPLDKRN